MGRKLSVSNNLSLSFPLREKASRFNNNTKHYSFRLQNPLVKIKNHFVQNSEEIARKTIRCRSVLYLAETTCLTQHFKITWHHHKINVG